MAYKFQLGDARLSGSLIQEGDVFASGSAITASAIALADASGIQGTGLENNGGSLQVNLNGLGAGVVDVANDSIAIIDANDSNITKKESIVDLVSGIAGDGLAASAGGQLSVNIDGLSALGSAAVHQTQDVFLMSDNGTEKKITFSNLQDAVFADVSGDVQIAAGGAATIQANAVEGSMLNNNIVSGLDDINAAIVATDELIISDGGTIKRTDMSRLSTYLAEEGLTVANNKLTLDINGLVATGSAVAQADTLVFAHSASSFASKKITFSDFEDEIFGNISGEVAIAAGGAATVANNVIDESNLKTSVAGTGLAGGNGSALSVDLNDLGTVAFAAGDVFPIIDSTDNSSKKATMASVASGLAGTGLGGGVSGISVDIANTTDIGAAIIATDEFLISDGGTVRRSDISRLATYLAEEGLTVANNKLTLDINGLVATGSAVAQADTLVFAHSASSFASKKITFSDFEDEIFGNVTGDASIAAGGALTIANDAVEQAMIADDAVGADQLASNAVVNASVATGAAIAANKLDFNVDLGGNITFGSQSDDTVTFGGGLTVTGDLTVNGTTTTINSTTIELDDKNIELAKGTGDDAAINGAGITIDSSDGDKTFQFVAANDSLQSNIHLDVASGQAYLINGTSVLNATTLGSAVVASSLTSVGTIATGVWNGTAIATAYIADDAVTPAKMSIFDDSLAATDTHIMIADGSDYSSFAVSGDATLSNAGVLTIAASAVEGSMLNNNIVSGLTDIGAAIVSTDEMIVSDNGTIRRTDMSRVATFVGTNLAVEVQNIDDSGTFKVGVNYFSNHGGAESATLPASPSVGQSVKVKAGGDCSATNTCTINRAGSQLIDGAQALVLESPFAAVELVYVAADVWRVF